MPSRFPLIAVPVVDDPFCSDGFCVSDPFVALVNEGGHYVGQTYQIIGATSVQWLADGSVISGAVGQSYTSTVSDIGKTISARSADGTLYVLREEPGFVGEDTLPSAFYAVYFRQGTTFCKDPGGIPPGSFCGGSALIERTGTCTQAAVVRQIDTRISASIPLRVLVEDYDFEGCTTHCGCNANPTSSCGPFEQYGIYYPYGLADVCDTTRYFSQVQFFSGGQWYELGYNRSISQYIGQYAPSSLDRIILVAVP